MTTLERTTVHDFHEAAGTVQSRMKTTLAAKIVGSVVSVLVREGDRVAAGQKLLKIDDRDLASQSRQAEAGLREAEAALEEVDHAILATESGKAAAEASLQLATSTLERFTMLRDRNSVSPHEFDEVASRHESAKAEVERAQAMLEAQRAKRQQVLARIEQARSQIEAAEIALGYAQIRSPFDGVVTAKLVEEGAQASPGVPLIAVESREYEIHITLPESHLTRLRLGSEARISVPAAGLDDVPGVLATIVPDIDPATRSYTAKLRLTRTPASTSLRSGMFARVRMPVGAREVIAVPASALVDRGQLRGIYALDELNVIRLRLVKTGQQYGDNVEVLSGLDPGDRVFLHPDSTVRDGVAWQQ
jgi:multidrug efflux pump subunit AcrA (membrane-fusion protein)